MFTHLHVHTEYSLLDGACRVKELVSRAAKLGQKSLAITDHGVMFGCAAFFKECEEQGIKPIIGCEVYVAPRSISQKVHGIDSERFHLILLCKNDVGYRNLISMVSRSWTEGFYTKPRIDKEMLKSHSEGLIALSGCLAGEVNRSLLKGDYEGAKAAALWFKEQFGDDYYLEIQNHDYSEEISVNHELVRLSKETGIELVATNDVHYVNKDDASVQEVLLCIGTNHTLGEDTGLSFRTEEFYLKSEEEMKALFPSLPSALANTQVIADKCSFRFEFGHTILPHFEVPNNMDHFTYFRNQCFFGLDSFFDGNPPEEYIDRLNYELEVINKMGYVDYFLIVADFIGFAKRSGIAVGPGRGSGAGSLAAYCVGITGIDPLKYNLLFERFLNPERVSMPDFDIDFCYIRRQEVIDYVNEKYGHDHVAQIVTFGTLAAKAAVRDVGRALGLSYPLVDSVAKKIPNTLHVSLSQALEDSPDLMRLYKSDVDVKRLIDLSMRVEGMLRHASTHAAGVVITREPVSYYVPLAVNDNNAVTQYTMTELEQLGLLKMDFLGLRNLTVIDDTVKMVRKLDPSFSIENISLEDELTYELLSQGRTNAVFQLESEGMKRVLTRLKPKSIEDLTAIISLYRPGPADSIDTYINNKNHPENTVYKTELLKDILDVTYGCIVYQEQVMEICRKVAGYSYGRADLVRRAMAKKKADVMERERRNFIYGLKNEDGSVNCAGAVANGVSEEVANEIFDEMSGFAKYAFNKSHACAYAHVSYQTAYLKAHYPCQLMAATLTSVLDNSRKVSAYITEIKSMGISVVAPNVNVSERFFLAEGGRIVFGLEAIKNIGRGLIDKIVSERELHGRYISFDNFCKRIFGREANRRAIESLVKAGACDGLGLNRRQMLFALPQILDSLDSERSRNVTGQIGFFDAGAGFEAADLLCEIPQMEELPAVELLAYEKELTGLYFSGHPMEEFAYLTRIVRADAIAALIPAEDEEASYADNSSVRVFGMITGIDKRKTKKGDWMCTLRIEDTSAAMDCLVFSSVLSKKSDLITAGGIVVVDGRLSLRDNQEPVIIVNDIQPNPKNLYPRSDYEKKRGIFVRLTEQNKKHSAKLEVLAAEFPGAENLYLYDEKQKSYSLAGKISNCDAVKEYLSLIFGKSNVAERL